MAPCSNFFTVATPCVANCSNEKLFVLDDRPPYFQAMKCRLFFCAAALPLAGCVDVKPIEVKPIHVTVDVNVNVKVDKSLDNYFDDIDEKSTTTVPEAKPAVQPAPAPSTP
jgi:hypothetical protein